VLQNGSVEILFLDSFISNRIKFATHRKYASTNGPHFSGFSPEMIKPNLAGRALAKLEEL
jgi:hypothetical protein